jgi:hypothetical protein
MCKTRIYGGACLHQGSTLPNLHMMPFAKDPGVLTSGGGSGNLGLQESANYSCG